MRDVTMKIVKAWNNGEKRAIRNTRTDGQRIYLHGNCIVKRENGEVYISTNGWNTLTTRERLNGVLKSLDLMASIHQHKHELYFWSAATGSVAWNGEWMKVA